jgi:hypothetical protein
VTGAADGARHVAAARALDIPQGATIVEDCETPGDKVPTADRIAHVDAASALVVQAGFTSCAYIGALYGLTSAQWQARPHVTQYAKSASRLRDYNDTPIEPERGFSWVQGPTRMYGGVPIDIGLALPDYYGGRLHAVYDAAARSP